MDNEIINDINSVYESPLYKDILKGKTNKELSIEECGECLKEIEKYLGYRIKGQDEMIRAINLSMITNEHVLLEGLPGVGKTIMVESAAEIVGLPFQRIQFIPDMLPSDLIGRDYLDPILLQKGDPNAVQWIDGPLFSSLVLADEINRAPSKVQAALLEAMGESQITPFGKQKMMVRSAIHEAAIRAWKKDKGLFNMPKIDPQKKNLTQFNVFATMNPIEQEGTYPLSEAQLDRFCFKINVHYPLQDNYLEIMESAYEADEKPESPKKVYGKRKFKEYYDYFIKNPGDIETVLTPLYFYLLCRDHIFGSITDRKNNLFLSLKEKYDKNRENSLLQNVFDIIFLSSFKYQLQEPNQLWESKSNTENFKISLNQRMSYLNKINKKVMDKSKSSCVKTGASPRGFLKLLKAVMGDMLINGGKESSKNSIKQITYNVLKHRIRMEINARMEGISTEDIIDKLLEFILN